jgi:hypothetical protein
MLPTTVFSDTSTVLSATTTDAATFSDTGDAAHIIHAANIHPAAPHCIHASNILPAAAHRIHPSNIPDAAGIGQSANISNALLLAG